MLAKATLPKMTDISTYGLVQALLMLVRCGGRVEHRGQVDQLAPVEQPGHKVLQDRLALKAYRVIQVQQVLLVLPALPARVVQHLRCLDLLDQSELQDQQA